MNFGIYIFQVIDIHKNNNGHQPLGDLVIHGTCYLPHLSLNYHNTSLYILKFLFFSKLHFTLLFFQRWRLSCWLLPLPPAFLIPRPVSHTNLGKGIAPSHFRAPPISGFALELQQHLLLGTKFYYFHGFVQILVYFNCSICDTVDFAFLIIIGESLTKNGASFLHSLII